MKASFCSMQAKNEIAKIYRQTLDELPFSFERMQIETTYGDTNIIITGSENKPALVLPSGTSSVIPFTIEIIVELANHFRIHWIDFMPRSNQSAEFQLKFEDDSYGKWMFEILSRLNVNNAFLIGIEFGGFVALKALMFDEKRIAKAFVVTPAGIVKPQRVRYLFKRLLQLNQFKKHRKENRKTDIFQIPTISKNQASKVKTPLHLFAVKNDLFYSAKQLRKRANKIFTSLKTNCILNGAPPQTRQTILKIITETVRKNKHKNSNN